MSYIEDYSEQKIRACTENPDPVLTYHREDLSHGVTLLKWTRSSFGGEKMTKKYFDTNNGQFLGESLNQVVSKLLYRGQVHLREHNYERSLICLEKALYFDGQCGNGKGTECHMYLDKVRDKISTQVKQRNEEAKIFVEDGDYYFEHGEIHGANEAYQEAYYLCAKNTPFGKEILGKWKKAQIELKEINRLLMEEQDVRIERILKSRKRNRPQIDVKWTHVIPKTTTIHLSVDKNEVQNLNFRYHF